MATYEEAIKDSLQYFNGDELAADVFVNKYAMKNEKGEFVETNPSQMHRRMAKEFARIEQNYKSKEEDKSKLSKYGQEREELTEQKIFDLFDRFNQIIPQGSPMAILGNPYVYGSLSNCVCIGDELFDSYGGILYVDQQLIQLSKRRCGIGLPLDSLRPKGMRVTNAAVSSTGAVSFMERFSNSIREVAQEGRRGALLLSMDIKHPEAEEFALIKQDLTKVTGANISLMLSDEFMECVRDNKNFIQKWPIDSDNPQVTKTVNARKLWNTIVTCARNTGDPGLLFWTRHHWYSPSSVYERFRNICVNPCGELPQGVDSCRLIAVNLFGFIRNPFTPDSYFDYDAFYKANYESQRLMDDMVDLELESIDRLLQKIKNDPEPDYIKDVEKRIWEKLYNNGKAGRRTGNGYTALGDAIAGLNIKFDSDEALIIIEKIMRTKCQSEFDSSIDMAIERGTFEGFDKQIENTSHFVWMLKDEFTETYNRMMEYGRRNVSISTVAPTGSLSILSGTSSGIEPVFMLSYKRRRKINQNDKNIKVNFIDGKGDTWQEYIVYHPKLKKWIEITNEKDITKSPYWKSTALDIDWKKRIEIQAIISKYLSHSCSSTINVPENTTVKQIGDIYMYAWEKKLKGITIYRQGSRSGVLVDENDTGGQQEDIFKENNAPKRPKIIDADVNRFINNKEKWVAFTGLLNGKPYEIFTGKLEHFPIPPYVEKGKIRKNSGIQGEGRYEFLYIDKDNKEISVKGLGIAFQKEYWSYGKLVSASLRHGQPLQYVVDTVNSLNFTNGESPLSSWQSGVARTLKKYIKDGTLVKGEVCENCGGELIRENGCISCKSCGWSKCD